MTGCKQVWVWTGVVVGMRVSDAWVFVACAADSVKLFARGNNNRLRISAQLLVLARCLVPRTVYLFSIGSR